MKSLFFISIITLVLSQLYLTKYEIDDQNCNEPIGYSVMGPECTNGNTILSCNQTSGIANIKRCLNCNSTICDTPNLQVKLNKCYPTIYSCSPNNPIGKPMMRFSIWENKDCSLAMSLDKGIIIDQIKTSCVGNMESFICKEKGITYTKYVSGSSCSIVDSSLDVGFEVCTEGVGGFFYKFHSCQTNYSSTINNCLGVIFLLILVGFIFFQ